MSMSNKLCCYLCQSANKFSDIIVSNCIANLILTGEETDILSQEKSWRKGYCIHVGYCIHDHLKIHCDMMLHETIDATNARQLTPKSIGCIASKQQVVGLNPRRIKAMTLKNCHLALPKIAVSQINIHPRHNMGEEQAQIKSGETPGK